MRGCVDFFPEDVANIDRFSSSVIFGGDCYVNRYTEKNYHAYLLGILEWSTRYVSF